MLVDAHAHIMPAEFIARREALCERDRTFAELFSSPQAKLARADELLAAMVRNGADYAVALGFAWADPALCREHNDALLDAARASDGRIVPFCIVNPAADPRAAWRELERCTAAGARGVGELRPDSVGLDLDGRDGELLARAAEELGLALLFHASEPAGHRYPGKTGGEIGALYRFIAAHPQARVICAHWGGGLPFYALMPEVRRAFANTWFDTAATTLLYEPAIYRTVIGLVGAERILFGSDFPLLGPLRQRRALLAAPLDEEERRLILGENAARLLSLPRKLPSNPVPTAGRAIQGGSHETTMLPP
ncbi:MAG TPA: amidohydrolase family protein [Dehalococcoidia bacterium]|nr:amidohydrolase family protein [Dehalococcoidia bacterium]